MVTCSSRPPARTESTSIRPERSHRYGELAVAGVVAGLAIVVIATVMGQPGIPAELMTGDWVAFDRAADRAVSGSWTRVYTDSARETLPFLYSPFVVAMVVPMALLGAGWSFAAVTIAGLVAAVAGVVVVARRGTATSTAAVAAATVASGPMLQSLLVGQLSPLYLLSLGAGAALTRAGRDRLAGVALALTAVKPNVAVVVVVLLIARRAWAALSAMALTVAVAVALTLPAGVAPWFAFAESTGGVAHRQLGQDIYRAQVTLLAFLRLTLGSAVSAGAVSLLWLAVAGAVVGATAASWRRLSRLPLDDAATVRIFGTARCCAGRATPGCTSTTP